MSKNLHNLAVTVGDFIRYWGFRRIHGEIWTCIYLSQAPLSGIELAKLLKVSKALISPALKELEDYALIQRVVSEDSKTKRYTANPDVFGVIQQVLLGREMLLLKKARAQFDHLYRGDTTGLDASRMEELGSMIGAANQFISGLVKMNSVKSLKLLAKLVSRNS